MNYVYKEFLAAISVPDAMDAALSWIKTNLSPRQQALIKVGAANQSDGEARVVIFYPLLDEGFEAKRHDSQSIADLGFVTKSTDSDYQGLYEFAANKLSSLNDRMAALAKVCFTNADDKLATMTILHP